MTPTQLQQWIDSPNTLNRDSLYELRTLVARYPYFSTLRLLLLKNLYLLHDPEFGNELRQSVLYIPDRRLLFRLIEGDQYHIQPQSPVSSGLLDGAGEDTSDRTLALIDAFLLTEPQDQPQSLELDYAMDYTSYLLQQPDAEPAESDVNPAHEVGTPCPNDRQPDAGMSPLIDVFLSENITPDSEPAILPPSVAESEEESEDEDEETSENAPEALDDSCFTETLAKIYVKQHRYEKALEIIKKLNLNYPKKNAYFADQIRFLEKLIINAKSK